MEPRYYIKEQDGIFYIYPPSGGDWVAASREKEEAESMLKEKNEALETDRKQFSSLYVNGEPITLKNITFKVVPVNYIAEDKPEQPKPKRKRIPRVLRPTVTLSEQDWAAVHSVLRIQGRTDIANAEAMLGRTDPNPAIDRIKRGLHDIRLAEHIKAQADAYCDAIRNPEDDDTTF